MGRDFYLRPTLEVARDLLGAMICHRPSRGEALRARIVEVEAYIGEDDKACHARCGLTNRTRVMYGRGGHAYVYLVYGMHEMLNVVTESEGFPAAILVRGAFLLDPPKHCPGPGLVTRALGIDRRLCGTDLCGDTLWIERGKGVPNSAMFRSPRIGIDYADEVWREKPWRFALRNHESVSRQRKRIS